MSMQLMKMETKEVIREYIKMKTDKLKNELTTKIDEQQHVNE